MIIKRNLYKTALISIVMALMLISTAGAVRTHGFGDVILKTDSSTGFVDFLKFPACGSDCGYGHFMDSVKECLPCCENHTKDQQYTKDDWNLAVLHRRMKKW